MSAYIHGTRPIAVSTPLGDDTLLLVGFTGEEGISELFNFELSVIVEIGTDVPFEKLLGQNVMVRLDRTDDQTRYFSGICISATEGEQDETFRAYKLVIVPQLWFLGKTSRSRIFQNKSVPEILQEIFGSYKLNVSYRIRMADFKPRTF